MTPPSCIAHHRIQAKLGEGGMGTVYRATDTKLNREVAIKVLPDSFAQDPDRMSRFEREAHGRNRGLEMADGSRRAALDCGPAVCKSQRPSGKRVFQRRAHR